MKQAVMKIKHQGDYPNLAPSLEPIQAGSLKVGDLITNIYSGAVWPADQYDVDTMKPDQFEEHAKKFRRMIPKI